MRSRAKRTRPGRPHGQLGVTLVDAVIAVAIVVIAIGVAYPGLKIANETMQTSSRRDRIERAGDMMLTRVADTLRGGRIISMSEPPDAPEISVGIVKQGVDLEELQATEGVPWASKTFVIRYRQIETVKESDEGTDINGDGDRDDEFAGGLIEIDDGELARPITQRALVILGMPGFVGDLDGDGKADPLFLRDGRSVKIEIHLMSRGEGGSLLQASVRGGVRLRNVQE